MNIDLMRLLPFLKKDEINELVRKISESSDFEYNGINIRSIAPFVRDKEVLDEVFLKALKTNGDTLGITPFVSRSVWTKVLELDKEILEKIKWHEILPMMDSATLGRLYNMVNKGEITYLQKSFLYPFVSDATLDEDFLTAIKGGENYQTLLPFVSGECLHQVALKFVNNEIDINIDTLYPFFSNDDIKMIFNYVINKQSNNPE